MKKYRMKNYSKTYLEKRGFRVNQAFSNSDETYYSIFFPVCKWQDYIVLTGEIRVSLQTGETWIEVYDVGINRTRYAPFYYSDYGNYDPILEIIYSNIEPKLKEFNITEAKRDGRRKNNQNQVYSEQKRSESRTYNKDSKRRLDRPQSRRGRKPKER